MFQTIQNAQRGPTQSVAAFGAFVTSSCKGNNLPDYVKHMVMWTKIRLEVRAFLLKKEGDHGTLKMCLEVVIKAERATGLEAKYAKAYGKALGNKPNKSKEKEKGKTNA